MKLSIKYFGFLSMVLISCNDFKGESDSLTTEFKNLKVEKKDTFPVQLQNLKSKQLGKNIKYASVNETLELKSENPDEVLNYENEQRTNIKVWFGKLTQEECETLKNTYADSWKKGLSGVNCKRDAGKRNFYLQDFLTPVMQASIRTRFVREEVEKSRPMNENEVEKYKFRSFFYDVTETDTNCFSTGYEVLRRSSSGFTLHHFKEDEVENYVRKNSTNRIKTQLSANQFKKWVSKWGVGFGEVLIIRGERPNEESDNVVDVAHPVSMVHMAIFVDKNLLFDRAGNGLPGRLNTLDNIIKLYPKGKYEIFKIQSDFPHASQAGFQTVIGPNSNEGTLSLTRVRLKDVPLAKDVTGRYIFK